MSNIAIFNSAPPLSGLSPSITSLILLPTPLPYVLSALALASLRVIPRPHPTLIDWRFVRAVRPDDSAVVPSAPSPLRLQEEKCDGGREECS